MVRIMAGESTPLENDFHRPERTAASDLDHGLLVKETVSSHVVQLQEGPEGVLYLKHTRQ